MIYRFFYGIIKIIILVTKRVYLFALLLKLKLANLKDKKVTEELNNQILQELIEENERLKEIVSKYEKLVEMGLLKIPDDMKL